MKSFMQGGPVLVRESAPAYLAAAAIVMAAVGVRLAALDLFAGYPFITVFPAVVLSAYLGGRGPGLFAVVSSGVLTWYLLVPEADSFSTRSASDLIGLGLYGVVGTFTVWVVNALEAAIAREREAKIELARSLEEKQRLLRERELLLTEIRHRVGNHLQQITGLLMLQARRIADPAAKEAFANATQRVNLFAEVHQSLYLGGQETVPMAAMLHKVVTHLVTAHRPVGIACQVEVGPGFTYGPEKAVPLVMVVHELVCNALEHGFGDDRTGTIGVSLQRTATGLVRLVVTDDGQGLPPGVDAASGDSLGLGIVRAFARQLNGNFRLHPGEGGRGTTGELVFDDGEHTRPGMEGAAAGIAA